MKIWYNPKWDVLAVQEGAVLLRTDESNTFLVLTGEWIQVGVL